MKFYVLQHLSNMETFKSIHCDDRNPYAHIAQYAAEDLAECAAQAGLSHTTTEWLTGNRPRMIEELSRASYVVDGSVMRTYTVLIAAQSCAQLLMPPTPLYAFNHIRELVGIKLEAA